MSWRERLKAGSTFRGKAFHIISSEFSGGRRTVRHLYPQKDKTFSEDMGRAGRGFPVEAFLVGDDFLEQVEALVSALETEGPGELVHAYFGTKNVIAPTFSVRVHKDEGGYASVSINFEETDNETPFPTTKKNATASIAKSAASAFDGIKEDLLALHDLTELSLAQIDNVADVLRSAGSSLRPVLGPVVATVQGLADLRLKSEQLVSGALDLAREPADMFDNLFGMIAGITPTDPRKGVAALLAAYGFAPGGARPAGTSAKQVRARTTFDATQRTIQRMAVVQAAVVAVAGTVVARGSVSPYPSFEDALVIRDEVLLALDAQLELASDTVFPALMQLRADLVNALPGDDTELAHLISYTPITSIPSLVLSHRLYGNLDGETDLIARNRIRHPGFVVGARELEVLSRA